MVERGAVFLGMPRIAALQAARAASRLSSSH